MFKQVIESLQKWSRIQSFRYFSISGACCANEVFQTDSCRYDLERFGCVAAKTAEDANLLLVHTAISRQAAEDLKKLYDSMPSPKYVMAVGACACAGGAFPPTLSYSVVPGVSELVPVDVLVPGCPPRPEAIMNGLMILQEKISGARGSR